jgi:UDP-N-acetylmuramate dehydrogenase
MPVRQTTIERLGQLSNLAISQGTLLSQHTRFGIGGPAEVYAETADESTFIRTLDIARADGAALTVVGDGTNLIVSDQGFSGIVLRFAGAAIHGKDGGKDETVGVQAGAELQALVDYCIERGLEGLETMTGIPGCVGAAVYGNAGAYGHSIDERVRQVRFYDGTCIRVFANSECRFRYRESIFKSHKEWVIFSAELRMDIGRTQELKARASEIFEIRLAKYPPSLKCAGSIFKNLLWAELPENVRKQVPERVIREGKVPSAYFLEQVGAKGMRNGEIHVADYHANLIYNAGRGTARELREIIEELKARVRARFGLELEEEVQYIGFSPNGAG